MTARKIDGPKACKLYNEGWKVADIAKGFGVQAPAVYRHLESAGVELRQPQPRTRLKLPPNPQPKQNPASPTNWALKNNELATRPKLDREPCRLCGIRGDIGCKHSGRQTITWLPVAGGLRLA